MSSTFIPEDADAYVAVTALNAGASGNLRLYPADATLPLASTLNFNTGQTRANNAVLLLNPTGQIAAFCGQASGTVHFILDVNGYFQ